MRIVLVSPLPPARDGIGTYTADLARAYRAQGHEVAFVSATKDPGPAGVLAELPTTPLGAAAVVRRVLDWAPDVVHVQHAIATYGPQLPSLLSVLVLLRRHRVAIALTHHEVTRDTDKLGPLGRGYYGLVSRLAQRIHVHTEGAAERLARCGYPRREVAVYPHPVFVPELSSSDADVDRLLARWAPGGRYVLLLIGYIQVEKGHLETVRAVAELLRRRPELRTDLRLVFAGEVRRRPAGFERFERADREYERQVRDLVAAEHLDEVVVWTGHVPEGDFDSWFRAADLVLLPYRAAEESGIAGHAVAADAPVLASGVGGLRDLFGGTPLELPSRASEPFSRALEAALDDPAGTREAAKRVHADVRVRRDAAGLVEIVTVGGGR